MEQSSFTLQEILDKPLNQSHWPSLERIIKQLQSYVLKKSKTRDYIDAQRGTQKISQANDHIKRRKIHSVQIRLNQTLQNLENKHQEEAKLLQREYKYKIEQLITQYKKQDDVKRARHRQQLEKARNQLQLALPTHFSPDNEIVKLRWEQEQYAKEGRFLDAQKTKQKIIDRQQNLEARHKKFRQNNIKQMLEEIQIKHQKELILLMNRRVQKQQQMKKEKRKRVKEVQQRQARQIRQVKWIYSEEMRTIGQH